MVSSTIASIYSCGSIHSTVNGEIIIEYFFIIAVFQVNVAKWKLIVETR